MGTEYEETLLKIGFWPALVAFVGAVGYMVSAFLQVLNVVGPLEDSILAFATSLMMPVAVLLANALIIPLFCVACFYPGYSVGQRLFGLPWGTTLPGSLLLLALYFRSEARGARTELGDIAWRDAQAAYAGQICPLRKTGQLPAHH